MRATLDTNVFISALEFGGIPGRVLDLHTEEAFTLCTSQALMTELKRVLAERFGWAQEDIEAALEPIFSRAEIAEPQLALSASRDPDDNRVLECALESRSNVIVTGDNDLLQLDPFEGIRIVKPSEFLELLTGRLH